MQGNQEGKNRFGYAVFTKVNSDILLRPFLTSPEETGTLSSSVSVGLHEILHLNFAFSSTVEKLIDILTLYRPATKSNRIN